MNGYCDAWGGNCYQTAKFAIRNEQVDHTFEACGHHLAYLINRFPIPNATATRFVVVPFNPNVELLQSISPEGTE